MNQPQIFNFEQNEVRTILVNDEPYFVGKDVAEVLGYSNTQKAILNHVDEEDKGVTKWDTLGGKQNMTIINESGLYSLIIKSKLPSARKFKRWVTSEVLPSIRKNGTYLTDQKAYEITHNPNSLADLLLQAGEQLKQKDLVIQEMQPKALFSDAVRGSVNSCLIKELATILKQNGINIGQNRLFIWLRENGYLCRDGRRKNQPTQRSMDLGIMDVREHVRTNSQGELVTKFTPLVTGKGQQYFINKFLNEDV
ncbi:phage antirepressor KilAC domain-containing protein [Enterococcus mundtii]|uniref:phage antirepressor KilAC domain-containing protein n=1 Tax=Enterococcus mundtii TaxID=53346 RepID=UPI000E0408EB|nr:phage antirepressor [Enterococcus mundtii]STD26436.1 toxin-antitoxin system, toxin component, Bro family [Enterococcus mundtii]